MIDVKENTNDNQKNMLQIVDKTKESLVTNQNKEPNRRKRNKAIIISIIVIIFVLIIAITFSTIFAIINLNSPKIIKGIYIGKIDVSNLTKTEARKTLEEKYNKLENKIVLKSGNFETMVTNEILEVEYNIEQVIEQAYKIGRKGNIFTDNIEILKSMINKNKIELEVKIDEHTIEQISQNINNNIENAVTQSSYYQEKDKIIITLGKKGKKVNEQELIKQICNTLKESNKEVIDLEIPLIDATPNPIDIEQIHKETYKKVQDAYYTKEPFIIYPEVTGVDFDIENAKNIIAEEKEEYEIPLILTKPNKTINDIGTEAFPDRLSTFSTNYKASDTNRTTNLKLAANKINGVVILPGEEFSYNKVVGERTISAGYKEAATFSNGKVVNGLGGGICQISSTLYDAVVMANLEITERRNHQFVTSYLPAGKDATVVWGSQDFKFKNTRKYPIKIVASVEKGIATISIWGLKEEVEYEISIETKQTSTISYTTQYVQDASLPSGQQKVVQAGNNGRKVEAYKVTKLNGKVISTTLLSKDTYNAMKKIVHIGTKK